MLEGIETLLPEHQPRPAQAPQALEGIRVVDFTHFLAGPLATLVLADMGADVIKIEAPVRGEDFRHYPPVHPDLPAQGGPFLWGNRNKRSIGIDMKSPEGLAVVHELVAAADVVCENFSTGVMARFGLDYDSVRKLNPKVIYCSVSAYGRKGEFADRLGFDPIAQAESGFLSMNGYPDRQGVRTLSPVIDISTATMASNAILGALFARTRTGQGQLIEIALFDNALLMTGYAAMQHLITGAEPQRHGNTSPDTCPSGVFQASDRAFYVNCGNDKIFHRLMANVLERPDIAADPVLSQRNGRMAKRKEIFDMLDEMFAQQPWSHWQARMRAAQIPCGEVRSVGEALRSPEARASGQVTRIPHPVVGWLPNVALPINYSATPLADPRPAPSVGQHNDEILREVLGYDEARIEALHAAGIFGPVTAVQA